jgi:hypothetical protein
MKVRETTIKTFAPGARVRPVNRQDPALQQSCSDYGEVTKAIGPMNEVRYSGLEFPLYYMAHELEVA